MILTINVSQYRPVCDQLVTKNVSEESVSMLIKHTSMDGK